MVFFSGFFRRMETEPMLHFLVSLISKTFDISISNLLPDGENLIICQYSKKKSGTSEESPLSIALSSVFVEI